MRLLQNLLRGAGTIIDLFPARPKRERRYKPARSVEDALMGDWEKVGGDIDKALKSDIKRLRSDS